MRFLILLLVAAACTGRTSAPASSTSPLRHQTVVVGEPARSELADGPALWRRGPFRTLRFEGRAGVAYSVTVSSTDFDPYLTIPTGEIHGLPDFLADDDSGDGLDAMVLYTPRRSGDVVLVVQAVNDSLGKFTVLVEEAPPPRRLAIGASIRDTLAPAKSYAFTGSRGQRLEILAGSGDFDTKVDVGVLRNGYFDELASDDDGGAEGMDSRLLFTVPADGEYLLRVTSVGRSESDTPVYTLSLAERARGAVDEEEEKEDDGPGISSVEGEDVSPVPVRDLPASREVRARAEGTSHRYRFTAGAKSAYVIHLSSSDFDPILAVGRSSDHGIVALGTDDDGGEGTDSRLTFVAPAPGEYVIQVRAVGRFRGEYRLAVTESAPLVARPISSGSTVTGTLSDESAVVDPGGPTEEWLLTAVAGRRYAITMRADFDTYLRVGRTQSGRFVMIAENDDVNIVDAETDSTDSRLVLTAREGGEYRIRAQAYSSNLHGPYELKVEDLGTFRLTPESRSATIGSTVTGTLGTDDAALEDGSPYEHWAIRLADNERVTLSLSSTEFDPILIVGTMTNGRFVELTSNDDATTDTRDARVTMVAPSAGTYVIRVNTFGPTEKGSYRLEVRRER